MLNLDKSQLLVVLGMMNSRLEYLKKVKANELKIRETKVLVDKLEDALVKREK